MTKRERSIPVGGGPVGLHGTAKSTALEISTVLKGKGGAWGERSSPPLHFLLGQIKCEGTSPETQAWGGGRAGKSPHLPASKRAPGEPAGRAGRVGGSPAPRSVHPDPHCPPPPPPLVCWEASARDPAWEPRPPSLKRKGLFSFVSNDAFLGGESHEW